MRSEHEKQSYLISGMYMQCAAECMSNA